MSAKGDHTLAGMRTEVTLRAEAGTAGQTTRRRPTAFGGQLKMCGLGRQRLPECVNPLEPSEDLVRAETPKVYHTYAAMFTLRHANWPRGQSIVDGDDNGVDRFE